MLEEKNAELLEGVELLREEKKNNEDDFVGKLEMIDLNQNTMVEEKDALIAELKAEKGNLT